VIYRLIDPIKCRLVVEKYPKYFTFDIDEWLNNPLNYALIDGDNIAFAEYKKEGVYWVHFCFDTARGREAISLANKMKDAFCRNFNNPVLIGLVAAENKPAVFVTKKMGFRHLDFVTTEHGLTHIMYYKKD
jgi:hypothetical protein